MKMQSVREIVQQFAQSDKDARDRVLASDFWLDAPWYSRVSMHHSTLDNKISEQQTLGMKPSTETLDNKRTTNPGNETLDNKRTLSMKP
jgi:hypothetical protein